MNSLEKLMEVSKDFNKEMELYDIKQKEYQKENRNNIIEKDKRKSTPIFTGCINYFPDALKEVSKCSLAGQKQHNQGDKLYWDKNKSNDNTDALLRHLIDSEHTAHDTDGILHLAKVAWRSLATLQIYLEKNK
jgi:hypothetical protein